MQTIVLCIMPWIHIFAGILCVRAFTCLSLEVEFRHCIQHKLQWFRCGHNFTKGQESAVSICRPSKFHSFFSFTRISSPSTLYWKVCLMAYVLEYYCTFFYLFLFYQCILYITVLNLHMVFSALDSSIVKYLEEKIKSMGFHYILLLQWLHLGRIFRCLLWFFFYACFLY